VFVIILQMAAPEFFAVGADGTFATTVLQWEGFTRIAWRALCAVGYTTPPFYEGWSTRSGAYRAAEFE
jgi:hypothetical protein